MKRKSLDSVLIKVKCRQDEVVHITLDQIKEAVRRRDKAKKKGMR